MKTNKLRLFRVLATDPVARAALLMGNRDYNGFQSTGHGAVHLFCECRGTERAALLVP